MKNDFYYSEETLIKEYNDALKDEKFSSLVKKLKVSDEVAMKYTSKLKTTIDNLNNCSKCSSLNECKNSFKGCVLYPKRIDNRLIFDYVACKYKKMVIEEEKNRPLIFEEPLEIQNARMKDIDLTDKKRAHVIKWVKEFYNNYKTDKHIKGAYLHGSFGSGKSYILAALINELAKNGAKCVIVYYQEMLRDLKESFNDDFNEKMHIIKTCDVLMLDDIGAESVSEWNRDEILGTILQYRMDQKLPTFFTSNLTIDELKEHLAMSKVKTDYFKSGRIIERIVQLTDDLELISKNRRK